MTSSPVPIPRSGVAGSAELDPQAHSARQVTRIGDAGRGAPASPEPETQAEFYPDRPTSARPFLLAKPYARIFDLEIREAT